MRRKRGKMSELRNMTSLSGSKFWVEERLRNSEQVDISFLNIKIHVREFQSPLEELPIFSLAVEQHGTTQVGALKGQRYPSRPRWSSRTLWCLNKRIKKCYRPQTREGQRKVREVRLVYFMMLGLHVRELRQKPQTSTSGARCMC